MILLVCPLKVAPSIFIFSIKINIKGTIIKRPDFDKCYHAVQRLDGFTHQLVTYYLDNVNDGDNVNGDIVTFKLYN